MRYRSEAAGFVDECLWCGEPVEGEHYEIPLVGDQLREDGTVSVEAKPWHVECLIRSVVGGFNHLAGKCSCCGGTLPPDSPGLTKRQAAIRASTYFLLTRQPAQ